MVILKQKSSGIRDQCFQDLDLFFDLLFGLSIIFSLNERSIESSPADLLYGIVFILHLISNVNIVIKYHKVK